MREDNKMSDWFSNFTGRNKSASKARDRLKLILIHDRTDINATTFDEIKNEILQVISNHVPIDTSRVEISIVHEGREQRLIADIPIKPYEKR